MKLISNFLKTAFTVDFRLAVKMIINKIIYRNREKYIHANNLAKFDYIKSRFSYLLKKYNKPQSSDAKNTGPIWFFWWQGQDNMPEIVKLCYNQLLQSSTAAHPVVFLHEKNLNDYVVLPEYIINKVKSGIISFAHFSDIVRLSLLAEHGGLWIDSTVYVHNTIDEEIFSKRYFSAKAPFNPKYISRCEYTLFLLGAAPNSRWIMFARDLWYDFWKRSNILLDYCFTDFILITAFDELPLLKEELTPCIRYTPHIHKIEEMRNLKCNEADFNKYLEECQFYKLSYKLEFKQLTPDNDLTWYGRLVKNKRHTENG